MSTLHDTALGTNDSSGTSLATSDTLAVTAGDLIVVGFKHEGTASSESCSDGVDTYSAANAALTHPNGDLVGVVFYTIATTTGNRTITVSTSSARTYRKVKAYSFTPAGGTSLSLGNVAAATQSGTSLPSAGSASATAAGVAVCFFQLYGSEYILPGSGWSEATEFNITDAQLSQYQLQSGAGSLTGNASFDGSTEDSVSQMAIFNEAAAGGSHATSGALSSGAASVAGTATHLILHATSGALSAQAATIAGTAAHWHATTGALSAQASSVAGTATHLTLHATSGALSSQAATISGAAAHHHAATGVLSAAAATISGAADHTVAGATHTTSGALAAQDAVVAGSATHLTLHTTTGALTADVASVSGVAAHVHVSSGVLLSQAASLSGAATHFTLHATSGALTADAASVLGDAAHSVAGSHAATGALQADDAQISGAVLHTAAPAPPTVGADGASPMRKWRYYSDDEPEKPEPAKPPAQLRRLEPPTPEDPKPAPTPRKPASELLTQVRRATERNTALLDRLNRQQTDAQAMAAAAAASLAQIEAQLAESVALAEQDELRDDDNRAAINAAVLLLQD